MARTKAISLIQSGSTKADLAELSGLVIANIQKDTLAQGLKSQAYTGNPASGSVEFKRFKNSASQPYGTARTANKGTAIEFVQKHFGISPEETCTFGDNLNDIEMLQNSGRSYAVANARAEVIAAAKDTCAPYWENGVLQILKTFL